MDWPAEVSETYYLTARFCAYQDRCLSEIRDKLRRQKLPSDHIQMILDRLVDESYVDESRFADAFVRGKFRQRSWGRNRIRMELQKRRISHRDIEAAMLSIPEEEYRSRIAEVLRQKRKTLSKYDEYEQKLRLLRFASGRGYETELVHSLWKDGSINLGDAEL